MSSQISSARTKKRITVEERLRQALAVPLAVAVPRSKDGTVITGNNKGDLRHSTSSGDVPGVQQTMPHEKVYGRGKEEDEGGEEDHEDRQGVYGLAPLGEAFNSPPNRRATVAIGHVSASSGGEEAENERSRAVSNPERVSSGLGAKK